MDKKLSNTKFYPKDKIVLIFLSDFDEACINQFKIFPTKVCKLNCPFILIFLDGPQFRTKPHSVQADLGASVTLSCDVDGNPFPDISWFHEDNSRVVSTSPNLTLRLDSDTAGRYFCKAHVPGFPDIGTEATVYLKGLLL